MFQKIIMKLLRSIKLRLITYFTYKIYNKKLYGPILIDGVQLPQG